MVVRVDVLLQFVESALCQHVCKCIPLKRRDATSCITATLRCLRWVSGHIEVAQEDAVSVRIVARVIVDGFPQASPEYRGAGALLYAVGGWCIDAHHLEIAMRGRDMYRDGVARHNSSGLGLSGDR